MFSILVRKNDAGVVVLPNNIVVLQKIHFGLFSTCGPFPVQRKINTLFLNVNPFIEDMSE